MSMTTWFCIIGSIISFVIGVAFGRYDMRWEINERENEYL